MFFIQRVRFGRGGLFRALPVLPAGRTGPAAGPAILPFLLGRALGLTGGFLGLFRVRADFLQELIGAQVLHGLLMGIAPLLRLFLRLFGFRFGLLRPAIRLYHRFANGRRVVRAHAAHVVHGVFPQIEGIVGGMNAHLDLFPDGVDFRDNARAVGGHDVLAHLGQLLQRGLVIILLIFQAAHEPTAGAGNFGGVQREILLLGHFDGHGLEITQERAAADGPAAGPQAAQHFGLVPHADLPKFDAGVEHADARSFTSSRKSTRPLAVK